jgi:hypothetical protein
MRTDCSATQFQFEGFAGRQFVGAFDGGEVTSNGGAPLLREADRAIGLTAKVARSTPLPPPELGKLSPSPMADRFLKMSCVLKLLAQTGRG